MGFNSLSSALLGTLDGMRGLDARRPVRACSHGYLTDAFVGRDDSRRAEGMRRRR
jgi:hypothetical protein